MIQSMTSEEWQKALRMFYEVHPPPTDWQTTNWGDEMWRQKIDRIM